MNEAPNPLVDHPVSQSPERPGDGTVNVGGPGKGELWTRSFSSMFLSGAATATAVVAGPTEGERLAKPLDQGTVCGSERDGPGGHGLISWLNCSNCFLENLDLELAGVLTTFQSHRVPPLIKRKLNSVTR